MTTYGIDDGQPPVTQNNASLGMHALTVWAAMTQGVGHALHPARVDRSRRVGRENAGYAAHAGLLIHIFATLALLPSLAAADTLRVGKGFGYETPSAAIAAADDGDTVQIAPGTYTDCAVVFAHRLTIEGMGTPDQVVLTDKMCNDKALLVIDGDNATIRNLTLQRAHVRDGNGAGIRAEAFNLTVDRVRFINNQDGILAGDMPGSTILVENSLFFLNGVCLDYCAHAIYVGRIGLLRVQHTRFVATIDGHDIKSRAARAEVLQNDISDGPTGTSSYLIEAPNGGALVVRGNMLEKGPRTSNATAAIEIGAEGVKQKTTEITVDDNIFTNDTGGRTALLYNATSTEAHLHGNRLIGPVDPVKGDGTSN
jgi:hypothetical protein